MTVHKVHAKSLLRVHKRIDSWFLSRAGMNLYRGCQHDCTYCDGRSETYQVQGDFGTDVTVKINAVDLIKHELTHPLTLKRVRQGYLMLGGGVGDSYQPLENTYQLTKKILIFLSDKAIPIHLLTKSTLIERDLDLLKEMHAHSPVIVSMSFSSTNDLISKQFEPGVPLPSERLETLKAFKKQGIPTGMVLLPVIPYVTDTIDILKESIHQAKTIDVDFLIFGGMTLKEGKQKHHFYRILQEYDPDLLINYEQTYRKDRWGNTIPTYSQGLNDTIHTIVSTYQIPMRIPPALFSHILTENDRVVVILDHIDYLLKLKGKRSSYGFAAHAISNLQQPLSTMVGSLHSINGVGPITEKIIREILSTGTARYYEHLLMN